MCNNNPVQCTCNFIVWAMFLLNCCAEYKVIRVPWRRQGKVVQHRSALSVGLGQRTMSGLIGELTGQPFILPVMLSGHIRSY